jgi:hypothetical protein
MKVSPTTAPIDFAALKEVESAHDVNYIAGKLARRRTHYAFLFQRYQDILTLDDEGCEISVTLKSATKTVTLTTAESEECFCLNDMYQLLGNHLDALQAEILDLLEGKVKGKDEQFGLWEGTDAPIMRQVVALCMPQAAAPAESSPTVPNTVKAA